MRKFAFLLVLVMPSVGCDRLLNWLDLFRDRACTLEFRYGINLSLVDQAGDEIDGATVTLIDGAYNEVMEELQPGQYVGAGERGGNYTMIIDAEGFESLTITNIVIDEDECHVIPESFDVTLTPEP